MRFSKFDVCCFFLFCSPLYRWQSSRSQQRIIKQHFCTQFAFSSAYLCAFRFHYWQQCCSLNHYLFCYLQDKMKMGKIIFTAALSFWSRKHLLAKRSRVFLHFPCMQMDAFPSFYTTAGHNCPRATPTTRRPQKQATSFAAVIVLAHMILHPAPLSHIAHPTRYLRWLLGKLKAKCSSHFSSSRLPVSARLDFPLFCSTFPRLQNKTNATSLVDGVFF